jgi:hypothetical protein
VAYGDRQRCKDIVAVLGLQGLESGYREVWLQLKEKGGLLCMEEEGWGQNQNSRRHGWITDVTGVSL